MRGGELLRKARTSMGLSQDELAARAGTSRSTLSAYEHGRKSPTLETTTRLLQEAGFALALEPQPRFSIHAVGHGRSAWVPDRLPSRLPADTALADVVLPARLNWSRPGRRFRLRDRADRARVYEVLLREGEPDDIVAFVDGVLLVDLWGEMVLPKAIRMAWDPLIAPVLAGDPLWDIGA